MMDAFLRFHVLFGEIKIQREPQNIVQSPLVEYLSRNSCAWYVDVSSLQGGVHAVRRVMFSGRKMRSAAVAACVLLLFTSSIATAEVEEDDTGTQFANVVSLSATSAHTTESRARVASTSSLSTHAQSSISLQCTRFPPTYILGINGKCMAYMH